MATGEETASGPRPPIMLASLSKEAKAHRAKALEQKSVLTKQISETARNLAFGSVASCYALLLANKDLTLLFVAARPVLLLVAAFGTLAIILDAAQYVFGFINVEKALRREDQLYPLDWSKSLRQVCFVLKQVFAYGSALLLLVVIASRVV
jgi:hypothetical protein